MPEKIITAQDKTEIENKMKIILSSVEELFVKIRSFKQENTQYVINFMDELNKKSIEF